MPGRLVGDNVVENAGRQREPLYPQIYGAGEPASPVTPPSPYSGAVSPADAPTLTQSAPSLTQARLLQQPQAGVQGQGTVGAATVPMPVPQPQPPAKEKKKKKGFFKRLFGEKKPSEENGGSPPARVQDPAAHEAALWPQEAEVPQQSARPQQPVFSQTFISGLRDDQYIIPISEIAYSPVSDRLGEGAFANVYKAHWHGALVALKVIKQPEGLAAAYQDLNNFKTEVSVLRKCRHPNVVQLLGVCLEPSAMAIVMEYLEGGSLWAALHERGGAASWTLSKKLAIMREGAAGLLFLHSQGVVHRDVKSLNMLLTGDGHVKVADFGISRIKAAGGLGHATLDQLSVVQTNFPGCSPLWAAPEVMNLGEDNLGTEEWKRADMYSFGIVCAEILTGEKPYNGTQFVNVVQLAYRVGRSHRPVLGQAIPQSLKELLQASWADNPASRPSFAQFLSRLEHIQAELGEGAPGPSAPAPGGLAAISEETAVGHLSGSTHTRPHSVHQPSAPSTQTAYVPTTVRRRAGQRECVACMENVPDTMLLPCRHSVLCYSCAEDIWVIDSKCPTCRQLFTEAQVGTFTRTFQPVLVR